MTENQEMCMHCLGVNYEGSRNCFHCGQEIQVKYEVWLMGGPRHNTKLKMRRIEGRIEFAKVPEELSWPQESSYSPMFYEHYIYRLSPYTIAGKRVFVYNGNSEEHNPYRYVFNQMKRYGFYKEMDECL